MVAETKRNPNFDSYIARAVALARQHSLVWELSIGNDGKVPSSQAWDFCQLAGVPRSPKARLNDLGPDRLALVNLDGQPDALPLHPDWIDLIKATALEWVLVDRRLPGTVHDRRIRPLRVIATCARETPPWRLTPLDAREALVVSSKVAKGLRDTVETCFAQVLDLNHIANGGPVLNIALAGESRSTWPNEHSAPTIRKHLDERKDPQKLPGDREFSELSRIALTEEPQTFSDAILFERIKVHIGTGSRVREHCLIPLDWRRERTYRTRDGRDASEAYGISSSIRLRYFPGKQRDKEDSSFLVEKELPLLPTVAPMVMEALDHLARLTAPLRKTYQAQIETGRLFPDYDEGDLVPAWEFYPRLSGDLRLVDTPLPPELETEYRKTFDARLLERMRKSQCPPTGPLRPYVVNYFYQFGTRVAGKGGKMFPARQRDGSEWNGPVQWLDAFVRVGELEEVVKAAMPTKLPQLVPYKLATGEKLYPHEMLVLSPIRPLTETRNGNILDISRYFAVGVADPSDYRKALGGQKNNIFTRYGRTDEDRKLTYTVTHTVRHLMNTELFRAKVPDTAITKQFGRKSVQQSHVYDHRSLSEHLDAMDLPEGAKSRLPESSQRVLKLIGSGRAVGPIVTQFLHILETEGEIRALDFLAAEAGGFHATPYGYCVTSFLTAGCPLHLECFNGCSNLVKSDEPKLDENLRQIEQQLETALKHATAVSSKPGGHENQIRQIETKLRNVRRLIATGSGEQAFPHGTDLSSKPQKQRTILDA